MKRIAAASSGVIALLATMVFASDFSIDLAVDNTIRPLCQVDYRWCGAAVVQMALQGYPGNVDKIGTSWAEQEALYNAIEVNNDDVRPTAWWTEPDGLQKTLMQYGSDSDLGVNWVV